jgi:hypothetical protein
LRLSISNSYPRLSFSSDKSIDRALRFVQELNIQSMNYPVEESCKLLMIKLSVTVSSNWF